MEGSDFRHRLMAILAADAVAYSRLMSVDDKGTVVAIEAARGVFRHEIAAHGGRVIDTAGDSVLAVFNAASGAVSAAMSVQQRLAELAGDQPEERRMHFRIGVHLGDVIEKEDGAVYGDGVNIAARLQGLAEPGGIVLSESVWVAVKGKVGGRFEDHGEQRIKNISDPVRIFSLVTNSTEEASRKPPTQAPAEAPVVDLSLPDKPSIAVLAFTNMSGDPEQEYFTDGITEDIITELARFDSLFVIARNSSFTYKGKALDVKQVGRELGVRYVLEGSIRRVGNRVRVTAQLVDSLTGSHIWAERYDREVQDIFAVQEEVTECIVAAIAPQIDVAETLRTRRRPTDLSAYELAVRAAGLLFEGYKTSDRELCNKGLDSARAALVIDPDSTVALLSIAFAQFQNVALRIVADRQAAWQEGIDAADRALAVTESGTGHAQVMALAAGTEWLDRGANVLLFGPPGVGKSHLISGLGHALIDAGRRVLFVRCSELVQRLQTARRDLRLAQELAKLDRFDLLVLDDLSYVRRDQAETSVLFELIAERYERKSIAITANTPFSQWGEVFVDAAMTVAAVDRLVHHSTILEMNVESYRRRAAQAAQVPAKRARAATTTATT